MARPKMLKLPEVLEEIEMSRAAFYRMRARGKAPKLIKLPTAISGVVAATLTPGGPRTKSQPERRPHQPGPRHGGAPS